MQPNGSFFKATRGFAAAGAFAVLFGLAPAFAAGGGDGGEATPAPKATPKGAKAQDDMTTCPPGEVWDAKAKKCLRRHSGVLPDAEMTEYAFALASADRYQEALDVLDLLQNPNTPRALNYRGYATRKLGHVEEGVGYYLQSVALDPKYPQVREYLGEAYVLQGKFDLAKEQLATIGDLCGKSECEYYRRLTRALEDAHAL